MDSAMFHTNEKQNTTSEFADYKIRMASFLIDYLIGYIILALVLIVMVFLYTKATGYGPYDKDVIMDDMLMPMRVLKIVIACLIGLFWLSRWQATPGQRMLGLYVCAADGCKLKTWQVILRFGVLLLLINIVNCLDIFLRSSGVYEGEIGTLDSLLFSFAIIIFVASQIAKTREKLGLHDMVCDSRVKYGRL